jgi:hypothetical protein
VSSLYLQHTTELGNDVRFFQNDLLLALNEMHDNFVRCGVIATFESFCTHRYKPPSP